MKTVVLLGYMILSLNIAIFLIQMFGIPELLGIKISGFIDLKQTYYNINNVIQQYTSNSSSENPILNIINTLTLVGNVLWTALITIVILIFNLFFGIQNFILNFPVPIDDPLISGIKFVVVFIITFVELVALYEVFGGG